MGAAVVVVAAAAHAFIDRAALQFGYNVRVGKKADDFGRLKKNEKRRESTVTQPVSYVPFYSVASNSSRKERNIPAIHLYREISTLSNLIFTYEVQYKT